MRIEVINTGTELLLGGRLNTHGAWLGQELFKIGLRIERQVTVPDGDAIREALADAVKRADAVLVTGGLGPTSDDLTREITAEVLGLEMMEDEAALRSMEAFFAQRGRTMADSNRKQAMNPVGADVLPNGQGTAPGVYVPPRLNGRANCAVFLLPGPPRELYPMFEDEVSHRLRALSGVEIVHPVLELKFTGIGESDFHQQLDAQLADIDDLEFGYCAHIGELDLRLIGPDSALERARSLILDHYASHLISDDGSSLEATVVRLLTEQGKTLSTAESCTGGQISQRLTDVPGSSAAFTHGYVTYANEAKMEMLGVSGESLIQCGAVSETVANEMSAGALEKSGADLAVAVTGIAGPAGGSEQKPVGTAWVSVAVKNGSVTASKVFHPRNRQDFRQAVSQAALEAIRRVLVNI
ncbi:MAG: competence/damage-inducible protein A [Luteolibacter sp.]